MIKTFQKILSGLLTLSLVFTFLGTDVLAEQHSASVSQEKRYPILEAYLQNKNKQQVKANTNSKLRLIIEVEEDKMNQAKEELLQNFNVRLHYTYNTLFYGYSLDIPQDEIERLAQLPYIKRIKKSERLIPQTMNAKKLTQVLETQKQYATSLGIDGHLDGRGMLIATLDSGVDLDHPDMRIDEDAKSSMKIKEIHSPFTEKVPFAFNYFNASHSPVHEPPHTTPHGMHIAGILAGNSPEKDGFKGIAPNAQLLVYKVITYNRSTADTDPSEIEYIGEDAQYNAMEDAINKGADVISLSIGSYGSGSQDSLWQSVLEKAHQKGVVVVAAMGNWGSSSSESTYDKFSDIKYNQQDLSATVSVAANSLTIGVGSTRNQVLDLGRIRIGDLEFAYSDLSRYNQQPVPQDATGLGLKFRGKKLIPTETLNKEFIYVKRGMHENDLPTEAVRDKIVLVDRGGEAVKDKILRFLNKGAAGVIVINAVTDYSRGDAWTHPIISFDHLTIDAGWAVSLSRQDGEKLLSKIKQTSNLEVHFKPEKIATELLSHTGISGFSSFGPNHDLELKPDIVAPGENILSTGHRGYVIMQGTSMASPHIAGLSTLLLQRLKKIEDPYIKSLNRADLNKMLLMNTANILLDQDGLGENEQALPYLPRRQGAGQADLLKAFSTQVLVSYEDKGSISLKEIGDKIQFKVKLYNFGDERQIFDVEASPILTQSLKNRRLESEEKSIDSKTFHSQVLEQAKMTFPHQVVLEPHSTAYVPVLLDTSNTATQQFVEGFIKFISKNDKQPHLNIPYLGFKGNWNQDLIVDPPQWEENAITHYAKLKRFVKEDDHTHVIEFSDLGMKKPGTDLDDPTTYSLNSQNKINHGPTVVKKVAPVLIFLRDAYQYDVSIVNQPTDQAEVLRVLNTAYFPEKYLESRVQENPDYKSKTLDAHPAAIWDGLIYDAKGTGSWQTSYMKSAPEGQYYYRIRAKKTPTDSWQSTYMPIRVDNTPPTLETHLDRDTNMLTLNVSDNEGVEFVGATLNHQPIEMYAVHENTYHIPLPKDELTTAYLSIEAMDRAGNPVSVHTHLNEDTPNHAKLEEELGHSESENLLAEEDERVSAEENIEEDSSNTSHESSVFNPREDVDITNGLFVNYTIGVKHNKISPVDDYDEIMPVEQWKYKAYVWLRDGQEAWLSVINNHYNKLQKVDFFQPLEDENGQSVFKIKGPSGDDFEEVFLPLKAGDNLLKLRVFDLNQEANTEEKAAGYPGKQIYTNKYTVFFDGKAPDVELGSQVELEEVDETYIPGNNIHGKIYVSSDQGEIKGTVEDDLDEWSLSINADVIQRGGLKGHFGQNKKAFKYTFKAVEGEYVHLVAKDHSDNERKYELKVVVDTEAPKLVVQNEDALTAESFLETQVSDNYEGVALKQWINNKVYTGGPISNYAVENSEYYYIKVEATDRAGNKVQKTLEIGQSPSGLSLQDLEKTISEKISLKKTRFTLAELSDTSSLFEANPAIRSEIIEHEKLDSTGRTRLRVRFSDVFGHSVNREYEVTLVAKQDLKEDETLDHSLLKNEFKLSELKDFSDLFKIREGVSYTVENRLDLSKVTEDQTLPLTVTFYSANSFYTHTYHLNLKVDKKKTEQPINSFILDPSMWRAFNLNTETVEKDNVPNTGFILK